MHITFYYLDEGEDAQAIAEDPDYIPPEVRDRRPSTGVLMVKGERRVIDIFHYSTLLIQNIESIVGHW